MATTIKRSQNHKTLLQPINQNSQLRKYNFQLTGSAHNQRIGIKSFDHRDVSVVCFWGNDPFSGSFAPVDMAALCEMVICFARAGSLHVAAEGQHPTDMPVMLQQGPARFTMATFDAPLGAPEKG